MTAPKGVTYIDLDTRGVVPNPAVPVDLEFPQDIPDGWLLILERASGNISDGSFMTWTAHVSRPGGYPLSSYQSGRDGIGPVASGSFGWNPALRVFHGCSVSLRADSSSVGAELSVTWQGYLLPVDAFTDVRGVAILGG